jgi:hypothetical protein
MAKKECVGGNLDFSEFGFGNLVFCSSLRYPLGFENALLESFPCFALMNRIEIEVFPMLDEMGRVRKRKQQILALPEKFVLAFSPLVNTTTFKKRKV